MRLGQVGVSRVSHVSGARRTVSQYLETASYLLALAGRGLPLTNSGVAGGISGGHARLLLACRWLLLRSHLSTHDLPGEQGYWRTGVSPPRSI